MSNTYQENVPVDGILKSEMFSRLHIDKHALLTNNVQRAMELLNSALDGLNDHDG